MTLSSRQYLSLVVVALVFALGVAAVFAGEADDSPGLGGIGMIIAAVALWRGWVILRRR